MHDQHLTAARARQRAVVLAAVVTDGDTVLPAKRWGAGCKGWLCGRGLPHACALACATSTASITQEER